MPPLAGDVAAAFAAAAATTPVRQRIILRYMPHRAAAFADVA